jgi:tetratricopeptide (TPR) repeat protein
VPGNPEFHFNRANLLQELGSFEDALTGYDAALALRPDHLGALNNRGSALRELGRFDEALKTFDRALSIDPQACQAHNNRGNLLSAMGASRKPSPPSSSPSHGPRATQCHYNLGNAVHERGRYAEAIGCYTKALSFQPNHVKALINRAGAARRIGLYKRALTDYAAARRYDPKAPYLDGYVAHTRAQCCDWTRPEDDRAGSNGFAPVSAHQSRSVCCRSATAKAIMQPVRKPGWRTSSHARRYLRRRRVNTMVDRLAYVSPDFRNHAASSILARLIEIHDRRQFHVIGVAVGPRPMMRCVVAWPGPSTPFST